MPELPCYPAETRHYRLPDEEADSEQRAGDTILCEGQS